MASCISGCDDPQELCSMWVSFWPPMSTKHLVAWYTGKKKRSASDGSSVRRGF